jgi:DNA-binding transcriptional MerR regulator
MSEMATENQTDAKPFDFLDQWYEQTTAIYGQPIGFGLFDVELCGGTDFGWLVQQVIPFGVTEQELKQFVDSGIVKTWTDPRGNRGFLLFTPEQVKTLKNLQKLGRYSVEELRHIMSSWDVDIECTLEVVPYDDPETAEIEHYRRRLEEHIDETKQQISYLNRDTSAVPEKHRKRLEHFNDELRKWERVARRADSWDHAALTPEMQSKIDRNLFRLRWVDEWVRISNADKFRCAIVQGFSPEVFFSRYSHGSDGFAFDRIDWKTTLRTIKQLRSAGKRFPLRTPDFDLTEKGMILHAQLAPEDYAKIYERYQVRVMAKAIDEMGQDLWDPPAQELDSAACAECGNSFSRGLAAKQYCSAKCRSRAKQRRYRERDPERARLAQARYWKSYLDNC